MLRLIITVLASFLLAVPAFAEETTVQPHLFDDLNGNNISDKQEEASASSSSAASQVQEIALPDTPPEEVASGS